MCHSFQVNSITSLCYSPKIWNERKGDFLYILGGPKKPPLKFKNGIIPYVKSLLKKIREICSMDRRHGSGPPRTVFTEENMDLKEALVWSKEVRPHTHLASRKIAEEAGIIRSLIRRMVKKETLNSLRAWKHHKCVRGLETEENPTLASQREIWK